MPAWRYKISFSCLKNIYNIFQHSKRNFVSLRSHVISSILLYFTTMINNNLFYNNTFSVEKECFLV